MFADPAGSFRGTVTHASLSAVIRDYRDSGWQADFVAATGDLIQDDTTEAYERFREVLGSLDLPVHCVPGNHDIRSMMKKAVSEPPFSYCEAFASGNWLIIGLDSCAAGRAGGAIEQAEYDRMDAAIAGSTAEHVMVCLHHPPVRMGSAWLDTVGLANPDEFFARVSASGKVRLAIFGHVHQAYDGEQETLRIVGTPSTCRQFKPHSQEFAVDDRPPAYRRITLHPDGRSEAELIWVDDA